MTSSKSIVLKIDRKSSLGIFLFVMATYSADFTLLLGATVLVGSCYHYMEYFDLRLLSRQMELEEATLAVSLESIFARLEENHHLRLHVPASIIPLVPKLPESRE
jgi:hypothetical protein